MPLNELNNSLILKNKQNTSQIDPENRSPQKILKIDKSSPHKKSLTVQNEINLLKIKLSDKQFQLKKIEEDCSIKISQMQKQLMKEKMQKKNLQKQYKQKFDEEKQYYEKKVVLLQDQYKRNSSSIQDKIKNSILQQIKAQKQQIIQKYQAQIVSLQKNIQNLQLSHNQKNKIIFTQNESQKKKLIQAYTKIIKQLQISKQKQIQNINNKHRAQIEFYKHSQEIKKKQNQVVEKILIDKIKAFEQQITSLKTDLNIKLNELQAKNQQITISNKQRQKYRLDSIYWERKHNKLQAELTQKFNNQVQAIQIDYNTKLMTQIQTFQKQFQRIQKLYQQSVNTYQSKTKLLEERNKKVTQILRTLKSNEQDLKKIQTLQIKLIRKQFELQKQRQDLKICKLQLNNMDEMYHKMFQQAKMKSFKSKKFRLPSLLAHQNKSSMECHNNNGVNHNNGGSVQHIRQRKFSIRQCANNNQSISKNIRDEQISVQQ